MQITEFAELIRARLRETGGTPIGVAIRAGLPRDAIRSVLRGHPPSLGRAAEICRALDLDLCVGLPRDPGRSVFQRPEYRSGGLSATQLRTLELSVRALNRVVVDAGGDPIPDDLRATLQGRVEEPTTAYDLTDPTALVDVDEAHRYIEVRELRAAAGGGAATLDETVTGHLAFRRDWLDRHGLDPTQCAVIGVQGESMEPVLPEGCSILVDRARRRRRPGRLYALRTDDGLVVKRLERDGAEWRLVSEHPAWAPVAWTAETELVGEVRWMARSLP